MPPIELAVGCEQFNEHPPAWKCSPRYANAIGSPGKTRASWQEHGQAATGNAEGQVALSVSRSALDFAAIGQDASDRAVG